MCELYVFVQGSRVYWSFGLVSGHVSVFLMLWAGKRDVDFHAWQLSFWITGQAAEQQESSPLNPSHSKSGLDIPRQIFTQARWPPCRRSRGAKDSTDRSRNIQMSFSAWMNGGFTTAWYKQNRLEERKDLLFLMWFQRNSTFGSQAWCSTFPLFLVPYGTKPPHCYPSYCLQPGAMCCNGNVCKTPFTSPKKISTSPDIGIKSCRAEIQSV